MPREPKYSLDDVKAVVYQVLKNMETSLDMEPVFTTETTLAAPRTIQVRVEPYNYAEFTVTIKLPGAAQ